VKLIGLVRLGRNAEFRYTNEGKPVCNFSGAFNYGRKDEDGRRASQWVEFALWGERAEKVTPLLLKGGQVMVVASQPHIETFEKRDGSHGVKLSALVEDVELCFVPRDGEGAATPAPGAAPAASRPVPGPTWPQGHAPAATKPAPSGTGFDAMDDDIPF
jgi:single-strand DNA-binding protein